MKIKFDEWVFYLRTLDPVGQICLAMLVAGIFAISIGLGISFVQ
jgi:hypothetical protein